MTRDTTPDTFDCPNCGLLAVTADERCPDGETQERAPGAAHSRTHDHRRFVPFCTACKMAGLR